MGAKEKAIHRCKSICLDEPYLFNVGVNNLLRRCFTTYEVENMLWHCHASPFKGNFNGEMHKHSSKRCDNCQITGHIYKRHEMPLQNIQEIEWVHYNCHMGMNRFWSKLNMFLGG